jgi:hypothetical protein
MSAWQRIYRSLKRLLPAEAYRFGKTFVRRVHMTSSRVLQQPAEVAELHECERRILGQS